MARFATTVTAEDKDGNAVDLSAQHAATAGSTDSRAYQIVEPGYCYAVVDKIEVGKPYRGGWSKPPSPNPNSPDGKWNWEKIIPHFTLLNENGSKINRQDFTLGVYENGKFIRPDGAKQSPIMGIAQFFLTALGLFVADDKDPSKYKFDVNFSLVTDRVVRVRTGLAGYIKSPRFNVDGVKLHDILKTLAGTEKYTFSDIAALTAKFNELSEEELAKLPHVTPQIAAQIAEVRVGDTPEDSHLKLKNTIISAYPISEEDAAANGWFYEQLTGSVFTTAAAWETYMTLDEADRNHTEPEM